MDPSLLGKPIPVPTASKQGGGIMTKRTFFIIVSLVIVVIIGVILLMSSGDKSGPLQQRFSLRQAATLEILSDGSKNIVSEDLRKINSELQVVINSHNNSIKEVMTKQKKPKKDVVASESSDDTLEKLNAARLDARYDAVYKTVLREKLRSLNALGQELYKESKSKKLKTALESQYTDIAKYLQQLEYLGI